MHYPEKYPSRESRLQDQRNASFSDTAFQIWHLENQADSEIEAAEMPRLARRKFGHQLSTEVAVSSGSAES